MGGATKRATHRRTSSHTPWLPQPAPCAAQVDRAESRPQERQARGVEWGGASGESGDAAVAAPAPRSPSPAGYVARNAGGARESRAEDSSRRSQAHLTRGHNTGTAAVATLAWNNDTSTHTLTAGRTLQQMWREVATLPLDIARVDGATAYRTTQCPNVPTCPSFLFLLACAVVYRTWNWYNRVHPLSRPATGQ